MYKMLLKFWGWLCSNDMVRHCICVFLIGNDPKWEGDSEKIHQDVQMYIEYTKDPENASPELKEFALKFQAEQKLNRKIRKVRVIFNFVASGVCIILVICFLVWLSNVVEGIKEMIAQASNLGMITWI